MLRDHNEPGVPVDNVRTAAIGAAIIRVLALLALLALAVIALR
jgi:hypothetical protein